ncbi:rRNA maturation RNase YbeY [Clostridium mediterraneense]|uniref:rRNA maturation RNase YbeY n=1 Tax=Clostridium mediterraneense TaxID=1805472 RepID=UPI000835EBCF|nr:rRNA maturation RNase YbeY [Clostridium mediterraneense]
MIYVDNRQDKFKVDSNFEEILKNAIEFALSEEKVDKKCEVSLVFVDNEQIKEINNETRNIDRATDVLSFPMLDYPNGKVYKDVYTGKEMDKTYFDGEELILGDIVLSLERAEEQRVEFNHSFNRECSYLVVHSVLHLLGYDHMEEEEKKVMRAREEDILSKLKLTRND